MIIFMKNDISKAAEAFKRATEVDPTMGRAYVELGFAYRLQNELEKAKAAYQKAIELDPNDAGAHLRLGEVYQLLNMDDLAEEEFSKYQTITKTGEK